MTFQEFFRLPLLFVIGSLLLATFSCEKQELIKDNNNTIIANSWEGETIIFDPSSRVFYALQYAPGLVVPTKNIEKITYKNSSLALYRNDGEELTYTTDITHREFIHVEGIVRFSGPKSEKLFLKNNFDKSVSGDVIINPGGGGVDNVKCKCKKSGGDCDAGGEGSSECSVQSGPNVIDECKVECAEGWYACCTF